MPNFPKIIRRLGTGGVAGSGSTIYGVSSRVYADALRIDTQIMPTLPGAVNGSNQAQFGVRDPSTQYNHDASNMHFSIVTQFVSGIQYQLIFFEHGAADFTTRPFVNVGDVVSLDVYARGKARALINGVKVFDYVGGDVVCAYGNHGGPYQPDFTLANDNQQIQVNNISIYSEEYDPVSDVYKRVNKAPTSPGGIVAPPEGSNITTNQAFQISVSWLKTTFTLLDFAPIQVERIDILVDGVIVHTTDSVNTGATPFRAYGANPYLYMHPGLAIAGAHTIQAIITDSVGLQVYTPVRNINLVAPPPEVFADWLPQAAYTLDGVGGVKKTGADGWNAFIRINHNITGEGDLILNKINANSDSLITFLPAASVPADPSSFDNSSGGSLEIFTGSSYAVYRSGSNLVAGGWIANTQFKFSIRGGNLQLTVANVLRLSTPFLIPFPIRIWYASYQHDDAGITPVKLVDGFAP